MGFTSISDLNWIGFRIFFWAKNGGSETKVSLQVDGIIFSRSLHHSVGSKFVVSTVYSVLCVFV